MPSRVDCAASAERDALGRSGQFHFSLPDRDYYVKDDAKSRETHDAFVQHVSQMLKLAGTPDADALDQARTVLAT